MSNAKSVRTFSWMNPKLEVREIAKYGDGEKGVFAKEDIRKGELLAIFGGYALHMSEFFELNPDVMHYPSQIADDFVFGIAHIDETEDAYFFNHSCNPNAGYKGQIFLVAMRKIRSNCEVVFDYAMELSSSKVPNPIGVERFDKMKCRCGERTCRKVIGDDDWKIPEIQKKYRGYFQWYIEDKITRLNKSQRPKK